MAVTRILSDLHLAHPASTVGPVEALAPLLEGCDRLILNGDTLETCSTRMAEPSRQMGEALRAMCDQRGIEVVMHRGNHDPHVPGRPWTFLQDETVLVTHGDACFRFGSPWSSTAHRLRGELEEVERNFQGDRTGDLLVDCHELARRWAMAYTPRPQRPGKPPWLGKIEGVLRAIWPPRTPLGILRAWIHGPRQAADWLAEVAPQARVLIMGHTHRPGYWRFGDRHVLNTGAFHPFCYPRAVDWAPGRVECRPLRVQAGQWVPIQPKLALEKGLQGRGFDRADVA